MPAQSQAQQQAAAIALQAKRGEIPVGDLVGSSYQMYQSMSEEGLKDFAETPHDNLPEHV